MDEKFDVDKSEWEACDDDDDDDDELRFRCSSALDDCAPPMANSGDISTCEPIQWRPPNDRVSPHGETFDDPFLPLLADEVTDLTSPDDADLHSRHETEKDLHAICDAKVSQSGQGNGRPESSSKAVAVDPSSSGDHVGAEVSRSSSFPHSEPEVDSHSNFGKRVASDRRCSRRRNKVYSGKRRRRSPHPSSIYRLSLPPQTTAALWQPWQDDHSSSTTVEQGPSLQLALENLRRLSAVSNTSIHHGASASAITTSATGNVTSVVHRMTSSAPAPAIGN